MNRRIEAAKKILRTAIAESQMPPRRALRELGKAYVREDDSLPPRLFWAIEVLALGDVIAPRGQWDPRWTQQARAEFGARIAHVKRRPKLVTAA